MLILKPYRQKIDEIDRRIVDLLAERYGIIREVAALKAREDIPSYIQERVDEVRENAAGMAAQKGIDEDFIRKLYAQLIKHSCDLEEEIIQSQARPDKKAATR